MSYTLPRHALTSFDHYSPGSEECEIFGRMVAKLRRDYERKLDRQLAARTDAVGDLYRRKVAIHTHAAKAATEATSFNGAKSKLGKAYSLNGARFQRVEFEDGAVVDVCTRGRKAGYDWSKGGQQYTADAWGETDGESETRAAVIKTKAVAMRAEMRFFAALQSWEVRS